VRAQCAVVVFGKAMASLMELAPANSITNLSNPKAMPPTFHIQEFSVKSTIIDFIEKQ